MSIKLENAKDRKILRELKKIALEIKANEEQSWRESEGVKSKSAKKREELAERRAEAAARKIETKRIAEIEEKELEKSLMKKAAMKKDVRKVTEVELSERREKELMKILKKAAAEKAKRSASEEEYAKMVLVPNTNKQHDLVIEATSVDEALTKLKFLDDDLPVDRHPERRIKGSFKAFEDKELPRLKDEKPGLLLDQYDDMIMKLWKRSPQSLVDYTRRLMKPNARSKGRKEDTYPKRKGKNRGKGCDDF